MQISALPTTTLPAASSQHDHAGLKIGGIAIGSAVVGGGAGMWIGALKGWKAAGQNSLLSIPFAMMGGVMGAAIGSGVGGTLGAIGGALLMR